MRSSQLVRRVWLLGFVLAVSFILLLGAGSAGFDEDDEGLEDGTGHSSPWLNLRSLLFGRPAKKEEAVVAVKALMPAEFACNPFTQTGRLIFGDDNHPRQTAWIPFDEACRPSSYFRNLFRFDQHQDVPLAAEHDEDEPDFDGSDIHGPRRYLPWLQNKTIVFVGDSIDRFVLQDMCIGSRGNLFNVANDHPAAVPPYHLDTPPIYDQLGEETMDSIEIREERRLLEEQWATRGQHSQGLTNPWVCDLADYDATLISVFTFGYKGGEEFYQDEHWYHGPESYVDRLHHIALPLLKNLAKHLDRPQIERPDLVTSHAIYWDLRRFAEEDFTGAGWIRPYPEDNPIVFSNLSPEREASLQMHARKSFEELAKAFPGPDGQLRTGPTILWRSVHQGLRHNYAPWPRVAQSDSLFRHVIAKLQAESRQARLTGKGEDFGFDERLRIDEVGPLMHGQQHAFRDLLHPKFVPGSWLRADILLYELKRAVMRVDRTS